MTKKEWAYFSIDRMVSAKWNYKQEDKEKSEKLLNIFQRVGQVENIIIRELKNGKLEVVNGNHRLETMRKLKWKEAYCFNIGRVSLVEAQRIALETNETKFIADPLKLSEIIVNIAKEYTIKDLGATLPYSENEIEAYKKMYDFDWNEFQTVDEERDLCSIKILRSTRNLIKDNIIGKYEVQEMRHAIDLLYQFFSKNYKEAKDNEDH